MLIVVELELRLRRGRHLRQWWSENSLQSFPENEGEGKRGMHTWPSFLGKPALLGEQPIKKDPSYSFLVELRNGLVLYRLRAVSKI